LTKFLSRSVEGSLYTPDIFAQYTVFIGYFGVSESNWPKLNATSFHRASNAALKTHSLVQTTDKKEYPYGGRTGLEDILTQGGRRTAELIEFEANLGNFPSNASFVDRWSVAFLGLGNLSELWCLLVFSPTNIPVFEDAFPRK
jgi:type IV secretory pathway TrbL component